PGGEDDPAEPGHQAGDHEHEDPDPRDVDTGATGGLGVPTDRIHVPPEGRPLREERQDDEGADHQQEPERDAAGARLVQDPDRHERDGGHEHDLEEEHDRVAHADAVTDARESGPQRHTDVEDADDPRHDPTG